MLCLYSFKKNVQKWLNNESLNMPSKDGRRLWYTFVRFLRKERAVIIIWFTLGTEYLWMCQPLQFYNHHLYHEKIKINEVTSCVDEPVITHQLSLIAFTCFLLLLGSDIGDSERSWPAVIKDHHNKGLTASKITPLTIVWVFPLSTEWPCLVARLRLVSEAFTFVSDCKRLNHGCMCCAKLYQTLVLHAQWTQ